MIDDAEPTTTEPPRVIEERWDLTYRHSAGRCGSRFFEALEREERILGRRCPKCSRVLVPPRAFCDRCFVATSEWVPVGPEGTVETFTVVYQGFRGLPDPPYCFGYVLLDRASTAILNYIRGLDLTGSRDRAAGLHVGAAVRAVFAKERAGRMSDFWFEPAEGRGTA